MNEYSLENRQRRWCRIAAIAFAFAAAMQLLGIAASLVWPEARIDWQCASGGCAVHVRAGADWPAEIADRARNDRAARARLEAPVGKALRASTLALGRLPVVALLGFLALAFSSLAKGDRSGLAGGLTWLRRAAQAAVVAALAAPVVASLHASLLEGAATGTAYWVARIDLAEAALALLLALGAWIATWVLAAGNRAGAELDGFI